MFRIDKAILDTNSVICENIYKWSLMDRGFLSQNILGQLRNFVEYIAIKVYGNGQDIDPNNYDLRKAAFICRLGARHNKQMVCPADLCHQWCHKYIVLVGLVELLHTIETATIETFDVGVLLRNVCGNFVNDLIAKA